MKYKLLWILDVTGFTFLRPVTLLCYGEEPRVQLKKIGRFIVIPVLAVIAFVLLWNWLAPLHKTKSGEVPTPTVVWDAASSIWRFHSRESDKSTAYELADDQREEALVGVQQRLTELEPLAELADEQVAEAQLGRESEIEEALAPVKKLYSLQSQVFDQRSRQRQAVLMSLAEKIPPDDASKRLAYLLEAREHLDLIESEKEQLQDIKSMESDIRSDKFPALAEARRAQTAIAEEKQYLTAKAELLSGGNRTLKVTAMREDIKDDSKRYHSAQGSDAYALALSIAQKEKRMETARDSTYAKPWTLPDQILRSLACVFFGFMLGSAIAIPIGVMCGLSDTFMAAVTPFIALFKPVSPIVWLPIALIIVGGFITDPDKHWLMQFLRDLPLVGWLEINPAFIASGVTVALCSLWPTLVNTALGVASIDKDHINVARVLRLGWWSRLTKIVIPSSLPLIFAGLRISLSVGWMVLIAAELLSSSEGIGKFVWDQFNNGASDSFAKMFFVVFIVGLLGFVLDRVMIILQRLVSFDGAPAAL